MRFVMMVLLLMLFDPSMLGFVKLLLQLFPVFLIFEAQFSFHVRFCQATFATFSCFSYIWSAILLTYVAIGVVCCQNQNLLYLCSCSSKDIFLHFTPAAGKPSFPTFHRPRTFQTFADNMPHAKNVWIRGLYLKVSDAIRNQEFYRVASMFKNLFFYSPWKWRWISQPYLRHHLKPRIKRVDSP